MVQKQSHLPDDRISKSIQLLRNLVRQKPIRVNNKETKFNYDQKAVNIAFDRICYLWNLDMKKRAFIATIIKYSIPIDESMIDDEIPENSRDYFTGRQLAGMNEIRAFIKRFTTLKTYASMMLQQNQQENYQRVSELKEKIAELIKYTEPRIKNADFAYVLEMRNGSVYMSRESVFALKCFVRYALLLDDPDIRRAVDKNVEAALGKNTIGSILDKSIVEKLKATVREFKNAAVAEQDQLITT